MLDGLALASEYNNTQIIFQFCARFFESMLQLMNMYKTVGEVQLLILQLLADLAGRLVRKIFMFIFKTDANCNVYYQRISVCYNRIRSKCYIRLLWRSLRAMEQVIEVYLLSSIVFDLKLTPEDLFRQETTACSRRRSRSPLSRHFNCTLHPHQYHGIRI